jgi:hypothetical protein
VFEAISDRIKLKPEKSCIYVRQVQLDETKTLAEQNVEPYDLLEILPRIPK